MNYFLITYRTKEGMDEQRQREIAAFIAALDADADLRGRVSYRCFKRRDGREYYHLATAKDQAAVQALQSREFFSRYTEQTELAAEGEVDVSPLEFIAETAVRVTADV